MENKDTIINKEYPQNTPKLRLVEKSVTESAEATDILYYFRTCGTRRLNKSSFFIITERKERKVRKV